MKPDQTRRNAQRLVKESEDAKKRLTFDQPMCTQPTSKPGDALITRWYGGVGIRELPPTIDDLLGIKQTYKAEYDLFTHIEENQVG